jgi:hypothetical protein
MVLRAASLLILLCATALTQTSAQTSIQTPAQPNPNAPRAFRDPALSVTYFYPGRFITESTPAPAPGAQKCVQSNLSGSSITPVGTSVFVLSSIDSTCPNVLRGATQQLGSFTREQVLRQLQQYGTPQITQDPTRYFIDGHPAAITIASVQHPAGAHADTIVPAKVTYAAKACVLGNVPGKGHSKSAPANETNHILCFDFTTERRDLLPLMLAFSMQFDEHTPTPLVPGNVLR